MSLRDRGVKKFTSIMLPEHVKMVKQVFKESKYKEMPILDEQKIWENDAILQDVLQNDKAINIKYYKNHAYHYIEGKVLFVDVVGGYIQLDDNTIIEFNSIINIEYI